MTIQGYLRFTAILLACLLGHNLMSLAMDPHSSNNDLIPMKLEQVKWPRRSFWSLGLSKEERLKFKELWQAVEMDQTSVLVAFDKDISSSKTKKIILQGTLLGKNLLHYAARLGRGSMVAFLLQYQKTLGIDLDITNEEGLRAADIAALGDYKQVLKELYEADSQVFSKENSKGFSTLWMSMINEGASQETIAYMLEKMPKDLINSCKAVRRCKKTGLKEEHITPFTASLWHNNADAMAAMIASEKVDLGRICASNAAIHYGAREDFINEASFTLLVNALTPAQLNIPDLEGATALQLAIAKLNAKKVTIMLQREGTDVNLETDYLPPLQLALTTKLDPLQNALKSQEMLKRDRMDIIRALIMHDGIDIFMPSLKDPQKSAADLMLVLEEN